MKQHQKGFTLVETLLILILVAFIGFAGWYIWNKNQEDKTPASDTKKQTQTTKKQSTLDENNILKLASDSVTLTLPEKWTYKAERICHMASHSDVECFENGYITTDKRYADQGEALAISVGVYKNLGYNGPLDWLGEGIKEGEPYKGDKTSDKPINGYQSYYWDRLASESPSRIYYVLMTDTKVVMLIATPTHFGSDDSQKLVRQQLHDIAHSIKIN